MSLLFLSWYCFIMITPLWPNPCWVGWLEVQVHQLSMISRTTKNICLFEFFQTLCFNTKQNDDLKLMTKFAKLLCASSEFPSLNKFAKKIFIKGVKWRTSFLHWVFHSFSIILSNNFIQQFAVLSFSGPRWWGRGLGKI